MILSQKERWLTLIKTIHMERVAGLYMTMEVKYTNHLALRGVFISEEAHVHVVDVVVYQVRVEGTEGAEGLEENVEDGQRLVGRGTRGSQRGHPSLDP